MSGRGQNLSLRMCLKMAAANASFEHPLSAFFRSTAATLCLLVISGRCQETNGPANVGTNAPAASVTNVTEEATSLSASVTNAPPRLDYAAFKIINERNIFNANRSRRSREGRGDRPRQVKVETFSLVGTMSYAKGDFAFFDGSSSGYRKAVKTNDRIAGYKVADVLPNAVKLEINGKTVELPVGAQMRRENEGAWELVASSVAGRSGSTETEAGESSDSDSGGSDDALKRLLQRRAAEENK